MHRRNAAFAAIAVVVVLCIVGVSVAAVASGGRALAYSVNGTRVTQHDFDRLLEQFAENDLTKKQASTSSGSVNSATSANLMNISILRDLLRDAADQRGVDVTDADRQAGTAAATEQIQGFRQLPERYRSLVTDFFAYANALKVLDDASALDALVAKQARTADIYVNPRYGTWHGNRGGVCPPTGCAPANSAAGG